MPMTGGQDQAGADLPDGTYYILLKGKEKFIYKGSVTLIRSSEEGSRVRE